MTKNTLLNTAIIICKFVRILFVCLFIGLTVFCIHLQTNKDFYKGKEMTFGTNSNSYYSISKKWKLKLDPEIEYRDVFTIDNIKTSSVFVQYFKFTALLVVLFLSFKEFQKVMVSVKEVKTFEDCNVKSFRRIGKYIFFCFLLTSYTSMSFKQGGFSGVHISFTALSLMLLSFIMAEIFKEGYLLKQDNDLTI